MEYVFVPKKIIYDTIFKSARHSAVKSPMHVNYEMEIILVSKGIVTLQIAGESFDVPSGMAIYVMPFEPHSFKSTSDSQCHVLMFSSNLIKYFFGFLSSHKSEKKVFSVPQYIVDLIDKTLPNSSNSVDYTEAIACIAPLLSEIKSQCNFKEHKCQYDDIFLQALSIANRNFTSQITLESVARQIGINPTTLGRKFSSNAKVTFNTYVNTLRCNHAATLITETDESLTAIAYESGFGSIRSFNRSFLACFECTPSQYKKQPMEVHNRIKIKTAD